MQNITVNHVMSSSQNSKIFNDIISYFNKYSPVNISHISSETPLAGALIRHYHRAQLENNLIAPCVVTVHHDLRDNDAWLSIEKFIPRYKEASVVICLNKSQEEILNNLEINNTVVIPHGFNTTLIKKNLSAPRSWTGKIQLAIISKRYGRKVKGESYIHELAKLLDPELFSFILIGGDRLMCSKYLESLNFEVTCLENAPYSVIADFYQKIDLLLMTSHFEGGPANIPEAVAAGVPILCNPIGMAKDMVRQDVNGLYLSMDPGKDAKEIFAKLSCNQYLNHLKNDALKMADSAISWEQTVEKNCDVYRKIIQQIITNI
jgi:glycosyltransferase involved in cell wall biosynthesis